MVSGLEIMTRLETKGAYIFRSGAADAPDTTAFLMAQGGLIIFTSARGPPSIWEALARPRTTCLGIMGGRVGCGRFELPYSVGPTLTWAPKIETTSYTFTADPKLTSFTSTQKRLLICSHCEGHLRAEDISPCE